MVTVLFLWAVLVLAAPAAQAGQAADLLGGLSAKLQTWVAAWWPAAGTDSRGGIIDPNGRTQRRAAAPASGGKGTSGANRHHGRALQGPIRPECSGQADPNGNCI
jgi:hypothetical protein